MKTLLMRSMTPVLWLVLGTTAMAQGQFEGRLPTHQQLSRLGLERVWWAQAALNPSRDKVNHVVIDEDEIYVQASSGVTTAFDAETGRQKWAVQIGRFDQPCFRAVSNEELVLIVCGTTMYAVEKGSGKISWTLDLLGLPSTSPAVDEKQVYFGTVNGSVYAYSLRTIRKLFEERRLPQGSAAALVWMYRAANEITSPPIVTGRAVNFASQDGSLYSVSAVNRKLIYQLETDKAIVAPLARMGDTMFMTSEDHSFFAISLASESVDSRGRATKAGKVKWEFTSETPIRKPIWAVANDLYLLPDRGGMVSLDPETGKRRWAHPHLTNFLAILGNSLAASDLDGNLLVVSRDRGEVVGSLPMRRYTVRTGNDSTDRVFLATENGLIVCLRQQGQLDPTFYRYPDRLPLLPEFSPEDGEETMSAPETTEEPAEQQ